jgi:hypothetical protein
MSATRPLGRARTAMLVLTLLFVLALALAAAAWHGLQALDTSHLRVVVDGEEVLHGGTLAALRPEQHLLAVLLVATLCFALLLAVPLLLLAVAVVVLPVVLLAIGLPLVVVLAIAAVLLAPLALLGLLGWWLVRALWRENKATTSATINR